MKHIIIFILLFTTINANSFAQCRYAGDTSQKYIDYVIEYGKIKDFTMVGIYAGLFEKAIISFKIECKPFKKELGKGNYNSIIKNYNQSMNHMYEWRKAGVITW